MTVRFLVLAYCGLAAAQAKVYHEPQRLLQSHFAGARVERRSVYLSAAGQAQMQQTLGFKVEGRLFSIYEARSGQGVQGYGFFDTRTVRTKDETVFVALDATGRVKSVELVSFFEPEDYLPPSRWLALFRERLDQAGLIPGRDVPGISGATLTARAVSHSVRLAMALRSEYLKGQSR